MLRKLLYIIATILGIIVCAVIANVIVDSLSASQYVDMVSILCIIGIAAYGIYDIALVVIQKVLEEIMSLNTSLPFHFSKEDSKWIL